MDNVTHLEPGTIVKIKGNIYEIISIDNTLFWRSGEQSYGLRLKFLREDVSEIISDIKESLT